MHAHFARCRDAEKPKKPWLNFYPMFDFDNKLRTLLTQHHGNYSRQQLIALSVAAPVLGDCIEKSFSFSFIMRNMVSPRYYSDFSPLAAAVMALLARTYGLINPDKAMTWAGKESMIDIAEWVTAHWQDVMNLLLTKRVEAQWLSAGASESCEETPEGAAQFLLLLKESFERERKNGLALGDSDAVLLPRHIALFFPFTAAVLNYDGKARLSMPEGCAHSTVSLFKQLLCAHYRYCLHKKMTFDEINMNNNEDELIHCLKIIIENAAREGELGFVDLLNVAREWHITALYHAVMAWLAEQGKGMTMQLKMEQMPLAWLPDFARNIKNTHYIIRLLAIHSELKTAGIDPIISQCCDRFVENINGILQQRRRRIFAPVADVMKQKMAMYAIPNCKRMAGYGWESSQALRAWSMYPYELVYMHDGIVEVYEIGESATEAWYTSREPKTCAVFAQNLIIMGDASGGIELASYAHEEVSKRIEPQLQWGGVKALVWWDGLVVGSYESGAVVIFDQETRKIIKVLCEGKQENPKKRAERLLMTPWDAALPWILTESSCARRLIRETSLFGKPSPSITLLSKCCAHQLKDASR